MRHWGDNCVLNRQMSDGITTNGIIAVLTFKIILLAAISI